MDRPLKAYAMADRTPRPGRGARGLVVMARDRAAAERLARAVGVDVGGPGWVVREQPAGDRTLPPPG